MIQVCNGSLMNLKNMNIRFNIQTILMINNR